MKTEPDSSRAARATSTTSSTFLRACSSTPTFLPVVQNLQAATAASPSRGRRSRRRRRGSCPGGPRCGSSGCPTRSSRRVPRRLLRNHARDRTSRRPVVDDAVARLRSWTSSKGDAAGEGLDHRHVDPDRLAGRRQTSSSPEPRPARVREIRRPSCSAVEFSLEPHSPAEELDLEFDGRQHRRPSYAVADGAP